MGWFPDRRLSLNRTRARLHSSEPGHTDIGRQDHCRASIIACPARWSVAHGCLGMVMQDVVYSARGGVLATIRQIVHTLALLLEAMREVGPIGDSSSSFVLVVGHGE